MTTTHREKDIERFNQWASTYEHAWSQRAFFDPAHQATLALVAGIVHQPASVLDVGCGTGKLLRQARTYWPEAHLIGVHPANGMIEMATRLTPNATFFPSMAEALPLQEASVDLALSASRSTTGRIKQHAYARSHGCSVLGVLSPGGYVLARLAGTSVASEARSQPRPLASALQSSGIASPEAAKDRLAPMACHSWKEMSRQDIPTEVPAE